MISKQIILKIDNLLTGYDGNLVLRGLSLSLFEGEVCCVIGEEGSGKSTLLKAITQQLKSAGTILYQGSNLNTFRTDQMTSQGIDYIVQGGNILKSFSVEEHISLALSEKDNNEKCILLKDIEVIFPNMIALRKQVAGRLSGGERMILSIACLMATDADLLILDEPTAGLSPETCGTIMKFLKRMKDDRGKTILLLEHNYEFAFELADSVVTLKEGRLSEKYLIDDFNQKNFIESKLYGSDKS